MRGYISLMFEQAFSGLFQLKDVVLIPVGISQKCNRKTLFQSGCRCCSLSKLLGMTSQGSWCHLSSSACYWNVKPSCSILEQINFQSSLDSPTDTPPPRATTLLCRALEGIFKKGLFEVLLPLPSSPPTGRTNRR